MRQLVLAVIAVVAPPTFAAVPPGSPDAMQALTLCHQAEAASMPEKAALLERGLTLAEKAVAADGNDAQASFAVFCNLGERMRLAGLSFSSLSGLRRLRSAVDRTLELAPDYPDALHGKGALLLGTPRLLGGDAAEGERLLRRALAIDPDCSGARLDLARALMARGDKAGARAEVELALAGGEHKPSPPDIDEARKLLASLE